MDSAIVSEFKQFCVDLKQEVVDLSQKLAVALAQPAADQATVEQAQKEADQAKAQLSALQQQDAQEEQDLRDLLASLKSGLPAPSTTPDLSNVVVDEPQAPVVEQPTLDITATTDTPSV